MGDTFRVNGTAEIIDDPDLLADSTVDGKAPRLGLLVAIEECYTQCPKAIIRSELWNPERHIDRSELPSSGAIFRSLNDPSFDADEYDRERDVALQAPRGPLLALSARSQPGDIDVVDAERPTRIVERNIGAGGKRVANGTYTLSELPSGGTHVQFEYSWQQIPLSERMMSPVVRGMLRRANERAMERLAERLQTIVEV